MKYILVLIIVFYSSILDQSSQYFFDYKNIEQRKYNVNSDYISKNHLGGDVGLLLAVLRESYTHVQSGSLVDPGEKIIVEKPAIYYPIKKLSNYYKRKVKKSDMSLEVAKKEYIDILEKTIIISDQNTLSLETELKKQEKQESIIDLFRERVNLR